MPFARILRSSALMGGASVIILATGLARAKLVALLLGPAGVGLVGVLTSFSGNLTAVAGWGLSGSGVRTIAGATEAERPAKIAAVRSFGLRLTGFGLLIALLTFLPIGWLTFGTQKYWAELCLVGLAVPCMIATGIWSAILQAAGKIRILAKIQIVSALVGLAIGLPLIFFGGTLGVASSILIASALPTFSTWRAARGLCPQSSSEVRNSDIQVLIRLGGALMLVGWLTQLAAYCVRVILIREQGLDAAGYYQAAISIAGSLPAFVFSAMATDFFPRVAGAKDEAEACVLAEKQIQAGLLLALPLITGLLTLGRVSIHLLYAPTFEAAIPLLTWMMWGVFFRLLAWPLAFWLLARGSGRTVVIVESIGNGVMVLLPLLLIPSLGLVGSAIAFFIGYVIYTALMLVVARKRAGRWLSGRTMGGFLLSALVLGISQWALTGTTNPLWGLIPTGLVTGACIWAYLRALRTDSGQNPDSPLL